MVCIGMQVSSELQQQLQTSAPVSLPDPRVPQLEARAAAMQSKACAAESELSSMRQQLKSLQGELHSVLAHCPLCTRLTPISGGASSCCCIALA